MFVVLSISCTRLEASQHLLLLMCSLGLLGWLPLTLARLSVCLCVCSCSCLSVCLFDCSCSLLLQLFVCWPKKSVTGHSAVTRSAEAKRRTAIYQGLLLASTASAMFPWVCESDCVLVGVLCSVLFASVSLTLSFIICTTNSWALQEDNLYLMRFSYVWGLGNIAESSII